MKKVTIIGAGCAGLGAAYRLKEANVSSVIYEKQDTYGGLCRSLQKEGYTFDTFAHMNFEKNPYVVSLLEGKTEYETHAPEAMNYYKGLWVRNPVQTNLNGLSEAEQQEVIRGFEQRKERPVKTYEDWLLCNYGSYFTEHFPAAYTRKYWTVEPKQLEPKWIEGRMYVPTLEELLEGARRKDTPNVHYSKEMHYPQKGGYQKFLSFLSEQTEIHYQKTLKKIDVEHKTIYFQDGTEESYEELISTMPLPELIAAMEQVPEEIKTYAEKLDYTSGVIVSIGMKDKHRSPGLWFYIYDEMFLASRVSAPDYETKENVPQGKSSLQAEVYFSKYKPRTMSLEEIGKRVIQDLVEMDVLEESAVEVVDVREETYANIMFTPDIYEAREAVRQYLNTKGIYTAGRFGTWDYLWTGTSILNGKQVAEELLNHLSEN